MENLVIENNENQMILKINKKGFDSEYLISLVKRLQIESLAEKSNFSSEILKISEQINEEWWKNNEHDFLKGINR